MATPAPREQDVLFTANRLVREAMETMGPMDECPDTQGAPRFADLSYQHHRQAAQLRNGRLRTIEAIRRSCK
jgi:hypothetical protein